MLVVITALALPVSAATSYYTYTYSINGKDLRSPDAYVPDMEINSAYMGLSDAARMRELYPDLTEDELKGVKKVLTAAALTYVAALFVSLMSLLRLILIVSGNRGRRR